MKRWLRKLLGTDYIMPTLNAQIQIMNNLHSIGLQNGVDIAALRAELSALMHDELSPQRKAASKALGKKVQERLIAEDKARKHTLGEL